MPIGRYIRRFLVAFSVVIWLGSGGCFLCGNGEPICGGKPSTSSQAPGDSGHETAPAVTKMYYRESLGYTCTPTGGGAPVPSYRNSIAYTAGSATATLTDDLCNPNSRQIDATAIVVSLDQTLLGYEAGIYRIGDYSSAPHPVVEAWCRPSGVTSPSAELYILSPDDEGNRIATLLTTSSAPQTEGVTLTSGAATREYESADLELKIDLTGINAQPSTYPAELENSPSGFYLGAVDCRLQ
jgi:hypothetical protein